MARSCDIWIFGSSLPSSTQTAFQKPLSEAKRSGEREREREIYIYIYIERERERERKRERLINGITNELTNILTNIGKDEQTIGKTKTIHPST